jgi:mono/diheme cytochrome c family protein
MKPMMWGPPSGGPLRLGAAGALLLTAAVWSVQGGGPLGAQSPPPAPSATYQDVYNGWKWWHVYCYRCHGTNAVATATAPDLIDPNRTLTPAAFLKIVRNGSPEKGMQAWDKLLDDKQISQIQLYVKARTEKVLPPGRPDEVGPKGGPWVPPAAWPGR